MKARVCLDCHEPGSAHYGVTCPGFRPKATVSDRVTDVVLAVLTLPIYLRRNR